MNRPKQLYDDECLHDASVPACWEAPLKWSTLHEAAFVRGGVVVAKVAIHNRVKYRGNVCLTPADLPALRQAVEFLEQEEAIALQFEKLIDILANLDEHDRPTEKLPNCPRCEEDELGVIHADLMLCYRCGWRLEGKRKG